MAAFEQIRERIVAELNGTATPDMIVTQLDSLPAADSLAATSDIKETAVTKEDK